jgi:YHS domain-containing protein
VHKVNELASTYGGRTEDHGMRDPVCGTPIDENTEFTADIRGRKYYFDSDYCMRVFVGGERIAYFSMEIGLFNDVPRRRWLRLRHP